jgi:acetyl esterase/lipase
MTINKLISTFSSGWQSVSIVRLIVLVILIATKWNITTAQESNLKATGIKYFKSLDTKPDTIVYKVADGKKLRLLVVRPIRNKKQNFPAMVWIHGGAWVAGSPDGFVPHLRWSAAMGAVGIAMDYRLVPKPGSPENVSNKNTVEDCLADCADAIKYLREHAAEIGIDPQRIIVIGDSAGGHLALCLGTMNLPEIMKANVVINCNGISDMTLEKWIKYISPGEDQLSRAKNLSPVNFLDSKDAPILTMNGAKDQVVTSAEAESFYNSCKKVGIDTEYLLFPDMRHAFIVTNYTATEEQTDRALAAMMEFLNKRHFIGF